jgi:radical SAM-linked protein
VSFPSFEDADKHTVAPNKINDINYQKLKISYAKKGQAKFFGHLELASIFSRTLKRANIPVKFSEGFHPKPKISFHDPLPVGIESTNESLFITVPKHMVCDDIIFKLNRCLPSGLKAHDCKVVHSKADTPLPTTVSYTIVLNSGFFDAEKLQCFLNTDQMVITRPHHKKGSTQIDLKKMIEKIYLIESDTLKMTIKKEPGKTIRPADAIRYIFSLPENIVKQATVIKEDEM